MIRKVSEKKLDVKVMIHFTLGCPPSLHVCGTVLKIAIQGHADAGGSERGRLSERVRGGRGGGAVKRTSHKERRSGMERSARGGERASIAILYRTEIDTGTAGVTECGGREGSGCQPGVSVFFAKALRTRPQISPAHGSQLCSGICATATGCGSSSQFPAIPLIPPAEISNFTEINSRCVIDLDVSWMRLELSSR